MLNSVLWGVLMTIRSIFAMIQEYNVNLNTIYPLLLLYNSTAVRCVAPDLQQCKQKEI